MTRRHQVAALSLALASTLAGCGVAGDLAPAAGGPEIGAAAQALRSDNGLASNGLNRNGLNRNGLNRNGLNRNGLATAEFSAWFNEDVASSDAVMGYVYGCAAPAGTRFTWTNPQTKVKYTWTGVFGLAPGWASGSLATEAEQQLVTACLAAHVNKYGVHVPIAVEGRTATGTQIPLATGELTTYSVQEACFFGNLFTTDDVFVAADHMPYAKSYSSARACGFETVTSSGFDTDCSPLQATGVECRKLCTPDSSGIFYESCTWNGTTYRPVTTRLRPQEVYVCGDGVCQFTERCGPDKTADSCLADCGLCP